MYAAKKNKKKAVATLTQSIIIMVVWVLLLLCRIFIFCSALHNIRSALIEKNYTYSKIPLSTLLLALKHKKKKGSLN